MERINVLDHGYVEKVDSWGSDEDVIRAARMSTDKGFLGWGPRCKNCKRQLGVGSNWITCPNEDCDGVDAEPGDEKLLRYLYEHKHMTPFEMGGITIEVQAPIMVFREWQRHRVPFGYNEMCLTGDTEITCISSGGFVRHYTIAHLYQTRHIGVIEQHPQPGRHPRTRLLPSCRERTLRVLDPETELYTTAPMAEVWQSGNQDVWLVETAKGHSIKASASHPFYTRDGWKKLGDLRPGDRLAANGLVAAMERPIPPALRAGIGVWTSMMRSRIIQDEDRCHVCEKLFPFTDLELDHVVPVVADLRRALDEENLRPICEACHKSKSAGERQYRVGQTRLGLRWVDLLKRPVRVGNEMTYDIGVDGPHKNFVANGLVVHNSARYTPLPDLNYVPRVERLLLGGSGGNKQAGTVAGAEMLTEAVAGELMDEERAFNEAAERFYQKKLQLGVPKELARTHIGVSRYSRMRATGNLRGWLAFLTLRMDKAAQWEIRQYANGVGSFVEKLFPRTWALFAEGA